MRTRWSASEYSERLRKSVEKEAITSAALTRTDIDKKLASIERTCNRLISKQVSSFDAMMLGFCYRDQGAAALGATWDGEKRVFTPCKSTYFSPEITTYCTQKLNSWHQPLFAKTNSAKEAFEQRETEAYMSGPGAQAKKKLDEIIASGDRNLESVRGWCDRLYGPLDLNKNDFLPRCNSYVTTKLDALTGGQASKDAQASAKAKEMNDGLQLAYLSHMTVKACYEARKEFKIQYVTKGQLDQATQHKDVAETYLVKQGASKELAYKRASDQFSPSKDLLSATQSDYSEKRKKFCEEGVSVLLFLSQKAN